MELGPIAASGQKAPDSSKALCQCNGRDNQVQVMKKAYFFNPAINITGSDSADDPAIDNKAAGEA